MEYRVLHSVAGTSGGNGYSYEIGQILTLDTDITETLRDDLMTAGHIEEAADLILGYLGDSDITDASSLGGVTPTAAGLAILDDANAAAQRTTLGLVIGTNVLAPNGNGSSLTNVNAATLASTTPTAAGLALLDDADVAAQRTTLGLVIGTDVLAPNGNGSALTNINAAEILNTSPTAAALSFFEAPDAEGQRDALELGTIAVEDAGASAGPFTTITSITVVNGIVTALTGS